MQLIGSVTSPFVRRIRLLLSNVEHDFLTIDIFSVEGQLILGDSNPAKKIPILKDGEHTIFDSRVIANYLNEKLSLKKLTWEQENLLTMIDAANDSLVSLFICSKSDLSTDEDRLFFTLQRERIKAVLTALDKAATNHEFTGWQYPQICLFCLLDWIDFRDLTQWRHYKGLVDFYDEACKREDTQATNPR